MQILTYIRYHETEQLFKMYPTLKAILESLQIDLNSIEEQQTLDDDIYSECIGKHGEGIIPPIGHISDTTGNVAIRYKYEATIIGKQLKSDIIKLSSVIEKLDLGIKSLTELQKLILETYYWKESMTWKQVIEILKEHNFYKNKDQAMTERSKAINKIASIAKIDMDAFNWVIELVNGKEIEG